MKNLKAFVIICLLSVTAFGQNSISTTLRNTFYQGSLLSPQVIVCTAHKIGNSAWSLANYDFLGKGWGEAFVGLQYSPSPIFYATVYAGPETESWLRLAAEAQVSWKKISFYNYYEFGKTPACWLSVLSVSLTNNFKGKVKSYLSGNTLRIGPGFSWSIAKTPLCIMPTALYHSTRKQIGLQLDVGYNF